jgi:hypothetical protein
MRSHSKMLTGASFVQFLITSCATSSLHRSLGGNARRLDGECHLSSDLIVEWQQRSGSTQHQPWQIDEFVHNCAGDGTPRLCTFFRICIEQRAVSEPADQPRGLQHKRASDR